MAQEVLSARTGPGNGEDERTDADGRNTVEEPPLHQIKSLHISDTEQESEMTDPEEDDDAGNDPEVLDDEKMPLKSSLKSSLKVGRGLDYFV